MLRSAEERVTIDNGLYLNLNPQANIEHYKDYFHTNILSFLRIEQKKTTRDEINL